MNIDDLKNELKKIGVTIQRDMEYPTEIYGDTARAAFTKLFTDVDSFVKLFDESGYSHFAFYELVENTMRNPNTLEIETFYKIRFAAWGVKPEVKKLLVKFYEDCGRMGSIEGIFTTTREELDSIIGQEIYFGEILGKHSEVIVSIEESNFEIKSDDQDFINKLEDIFGAGTVSGYNPFDYWGQEQ